MTASGRGCLIALEGGETSGKTTQARLLGAALGAVVTREPGGTHIGERIRSLLLEVAPDQPADRPEASPPHRPPLPVPLVPRTEALLMLAARAQHVDEVVEPALAGGRWVVTDRFAGSTLAYQGCGRGLDLVELRCVSSWAAGGLWPDLSILLEVPVEVLATRRPADEGRDRFEAEDPAFHGRVAIGYRSLAAAEPDRWAIVDGSGPPIAVAARILEAVRARLGDESSVCLRSGHGGPGGQSPLGR